LCIQHVAQWNAHVQVPDVACRQLQLLLLLLLLQGASTPVE
jgi:hypothetical protein